MPVCLLSGRGWVARDQSRKKLVGFFRKNWLMLGAIIRQIPTENEAPPSCVCPLLIIYVRVYVYRHTVHRSTSIHAEYYTGDVYLPWCTYTPLFAANPL